MRRELVSAQGSRGYRGGSAPRLRRPLGGASERTSPAPFRKPSMAGPGFLVGRAGAKLNLFDVQDVLPVGFVP